MKILFRLHRNDKWEHLNHSGYSEEAGLRDMLHDDPDIIPIEDMSSSEEISPIKLMIKEVGLPGSGSTDLVGIDKNGNIFIIETKLATNSEAKREVIGQILEYAAFLWEKGFDWINNVAKKKKGYSISQYFEKESDWDKENFEQNLRGNLTEGRFKLFVVVDEVNVDLKRTINYMSEKLGVEICALELRHFKEKSGIEILVPNVHGGKKQAISIPKPSWTEESYFKDAAVKVDSKTLQTLHRLYDFCRGLGEVDFGSGRVTGTFRVSLPFKGKFIRFCVIAPARMWTWFMFKEMSQKGVQKTLLLEYIRQLNSLGFQLDETKDAEADPTFDVTILNDEAKHSAFEKYTNELKEKLTRQ